MSCCCQRQRYTAAPGTGHYSPSQEQPRPDHFVMVAGSGLTLPQQLRRSLSHLLRGMQGRAAAAHSSLRRPAGTVQLRSIWGEAGRRSGAASCRRAGLPGGSLGHPRRCAAQHCRHDLRHVSASPPNLLSIMLFGYNVHPAVRGCMALPELTLRSAANISYLPGLHTAVCGCMALPELTVRSAANMPCLPGLQRALK